MIRTYRTLSPGEAIPVWAPFRGPDKGYVRLRWKVGKGSYVETYEHRVRDGVVTTSAHVHHRNGIRDDNAPTNLEHVSELEHHERHAVYDIEEAIRLHDAGVTFAALARRYGVHPTSVLRRFQRRGHVSANPRGKRAVQTHCIHGHELSYDNVYHYGNHRPCRLCICEARRVKRRKETADALC